MSNQKRITATSTRKEIVAELQFMEGYLKNDINWYATKLGINYKGEQTYKSDLQELYKKVSASYHYKVIALKEAKEVGLILNAKHFTLKQVRTMINEVIGSEAQETKRKKANVIVYEGSENVTDDDVKKLEKLANKDLPKPELPKMNIPQEVEEAMKEVEQAMAEVASTTDTNTNNKEMVEMTKTQEQLIAEAVAKAVAEKEAEMNAQKEEEMKAVVVETVTAMEEVQQEAVNQAVESVVEVYEALGQKGDEILEESDKAIDNDDFEKHEELMEQYEEVQAKRDELGEKHKEVIFSKERAEAIIKEARQAVANGLRTTATTTDKYGNAGVETLMDVANQILAGTVKVAETIIKGGEAIAQTGINVAGTVGKAGVKGVSGTMNAAADIIEPKQK